MIASLPMYDMAPVDRANDMFWAAIARHLSDAPAGLTRGTDPWDHWRNPDLVFSQTCGLPFRAQLHSSVQYLCTPDYGLTNCPAGYYFSYIVARDPKLDPNGKIPAVNDALSQSGWAALCDWAARCDVELATPFMSGAHALSLQAVQNGQADLAAVDAVTWRFLSAHSDDLSGLHIIAQTVPTPSLPFICGVTSNAGKILKATQQGFEDLPAQTKATLGIKGLANLTPQEYLAQPLPPQIV